MKLKTLWQVPVAILVGGLVSAFIGLVILLSSVLVPLLIILAVCVVIYAILFGEVK